jgi:dihydrofolate reductase
MGDIAVHEFITVDGVIENPSWTMEYPFDPRMGEAIGQVVSASRGILLGRRTYEMFAPAWSARTAEDDPGAPFFNESPKYVVSGTLRDPDWSNSSVLGPYDPGAIRELKQRVDGNLYVSGSAQLVRALLADGLVDQVHLFVYPLTLGTGLRLFDGDTPAVKLTLAATEAYESGVLHLDYRIAADH